MTDLLIAKHKMSEEDIKIHSLRQLFMQKDGKMELIFCTNILLLMVELKYMEDVREENHKNLLIIYCITIRIIQSQL